MENGDRFDITFKKIRKTIRIVCPLLIFCVACNCLTISVVVHLGIENYERLQESQSMEAEVAWMTKELRRISILLESQPPQKMFVPSPSPLERRHNKTVRTDKGIPATTASTLPRLEQRKQRNFNLKSLEERHEKCLARVELLEYSQRRLKQSQDFLREQTFQRLLSVERALNQRGISPGTFSAFSASNPATDDRIGTDHDYPIRFKDVTFNEGSSYDVTTGKFHAPSRGLYFFHASLITSQSTDCTLKLRKNSQPIRHVSTTNKCSILTNFNDDVTCDDALTMTQIIRLNNDDVIEMASSSSCVLMSSSVFQGYFIDP